MKGVSEADPLPLRDSRRFPALAAAHALFRADDEQRAEVEARVLANQPAAAIAEVCSLTTAALEMYESIFFDVRGHLREKDWLMSKAVRGCPAAFPGVPKKVVLWRWVTLFGGVPALEVVMAATGGVLSADSPTLFSIWFAGVVKGGGEGVGESAAVIKLPQEKEARIGGEGVVGDLDMNGVSVR